MIVATSDLLVCDDELAADAGWLEGGDVLRVDEETR